jgi:hypothetical protein
VRVTVADLLAIIRERTGPDRPRTTGSGLSPTALERARETDRRTRELLKARGWCLWQCDALDGEIIVVAADDSVTGMPPERPLYTLAELRQLCSREPLDIAALRIVHEAKKLTRATVLSCE